MPLSQESGSSSSTSRLSKALSRAPRMFSLLVVWLPAHMQFMIEIWLLLLLHYPGVQRCQGGTQL